ncbi:hypothetical protein HOF92_02665, partial [bacterium]|nr:hypothetical protein [bacterium]
MKNLRAESRYNPKLKKLFSGKWGTAADFYIRNGQYKIPTSLSAQLAKIKIGVDLKRTERELLRIFDPKGCLQKKPNSSQIGTNPRKSGGEKPNSTGTGGTTQTGKIKSPKIKKPPQPQPKKPTNTTFLPSNPDLSKILGGIGGGSTFKPPK